MNILFEMQRFYKEAGYVRKGIRHYGGGFMQAIGEAMDMADINNLHKIKDTWNKEWLQYLEMGRRAERNEENDE